jgi:hypothetical protein
MQQSYLTLGPSVAMSKEQIDSFLEQKLVARFTSICPDGYPHTTPLWYSWGGEMVWFLLDAGTYLRQHIRNLRRSPKLCVVIDRDTRPEQGSLFDAQGMGGSREDPITEGHRYPIPPVASRLLP